MRKRRKEYNYKRKRKEYKDKFKNKIKITKANFHQLENIKNCPLLPMTQKKINKILINIKEINQLKTLATI